MIEETSIDDSNCNAGPEPLPRFQHPEHGELTIYGFDGRSKLCRNAAGQEFRIGTRVVNRLMGVPSRGPASERTLELPVFPVTVSNADVAEKIPEMVTEMLSRMPDDPGRVRIAREIWAAADAFLRT